MDMAKLSQRLARDFMFRSLDYLYVPARDIEASIRYYTGVLGGELVWKIHKFGAWVACVRLSQTGPLVLLADHLEGAVPLLIYQVENLEQTAKELTSRGWSAESGPFEIPNGPCYTFCDPTGVRLAIYENERPNVDERFKGQFDS
jgi:predicted enzyme related to lactoylglutathione lyase